MSRGGIKKEIIENAIVPLGDNYFETGVINVGAGATIKKGVLLKRVSGKFVPVTDTGTETPVAVNPFEIINSGAAPADLSIRAIVAGPVRADLLLVGSSGTTDAQNDMLRNYGIIPVQVNDISWTE